MDIWTAASQGNLDALKRHLANGAEIDGTFVAPGIPASGATSLHLAVLAGKREVAEFLIAEGADINIMANDEGGGRPLHWAAGLARVNMAKLLIEAGADVNAQDKLGLTPLDMTSFDEESTPETEARAKTAVAQILKDHGARKSKE
jgi:ankyrin repeat protein